MYSKTKTHAERHAPAEILAKSCALCAWVITVVCPAWPWPGLFSVLNSRNVYRVSGTEAVLFTLQNLKGAAQV